MAIETDGRLLMKGDRPSDVAVRIVAGDDHLTLLVGDDVLAEFDIPELRIAALSEGFAIRAAGEEFVLKAEDDVGLAEEFGVAAAAPRLARRMAAAHNTAERPPPEPAPEVRSQVGAAVYGVAGLLVIAGGTFFQTSGSGTPALEDPWLVFVGSGAAMLGVAWLMTLDKRWPEWLAFAVLSGIAVVFAIGVPGAAEDVTRITAYGFVAGGLVLGMAGAATAHSTH